MIYTLVQDFRTVVYFSDWNLLINEQVHWRLRFLNYLKKWFFYLKKFPALDYVLNTSECYRTDSNSKFANVSILPFTCNVFQRLLFCFERNYKTGNNAGVVMRIGYTVHSEYDRMPFTPNERFRLMKPPHFRTSERWTIWWHFVKKIACRNFGLRNLYALQHHVYYSYVMALLFVNKIVGFQFLTCVRYKYVCWTMCCGMCPRTL